MPTWHLARGGIQKSIACVQAHFFSLHWFSVPKQVSLLKGYLNSQQHFEILLMSRTIERTPFMWEKGRGDKCCPGPKSCLPCARPVLGASVSEWHIRPWDGCHGAQRQGGVYLCQAPGGMVARGSGCAHRFSPKLGNPGIASVWDWRVVTSNIYPLENQSSVACGVIQNLKARLSPSSSIYHSMQPILQSFLKQIYLFDHQT